MKLEKEAAVAALSRMEERMKQARHHGEANDISELNRLVKENGILEETIQVCLLLCCKFFFV